MPPVYPSDTLRIRVFIVTSTQRSALGFCALALGLIAVTPSDAFAYVDPGTGSYLFQLAAAGLLAGAFTARRYWEALKAMFRGGPAGDSSSTGPSPRE